MDNGAPKSNRNMQEKTPDEKKAADNSSQATNEDLEEFESVNNEIDSINAFLDSLETNVDSIKDQLMSILSSNREIMKELKEEKESEQNSESSGDGNDKNDERPMET